MKKIVLGAVLAFGLAGPALAADCCAKKDGKPSACCEKPEAKDGAAQGQQKGHGGHAGH